MVLVIFITIIFYYFKSDSLTIFPCQTVSNLTISSVTESIFAKMYPLAGENNNDKKPDDEDNNYPWW